MIKKVIAAQIVENPVVRLHIQVCGQSVALKVDLPPDFQERLKALQDRLGDLERRSPHDPSVLHVDALYKSNLVCVDEIRKFILASDMLEKTSACSHLKRIASSNK